MALLPSILPNSAPPMTFAAFKELALRSLTQKDACILNALSLEPPRSMEKTGSEFLDGWYSFERSLRLALEQARSAKLKWDNPIPYEERELLSGAFHPVQISHTAAGMQNPLDAEIYLDKMRFEAADTVKGEKAFSSDGVFSYAVKLLLRERAAQFDMEKGREEYSHIYTGILESKAAAQA
jgi:Protein of unknown function (DUF2764).